MLPKTSITAIAHLTSTKPNRLTTLVSGYRWALLTLLLASSFHSVHSSTTPSIAAAPVMENVVGKGEKTNEIMIVFSDLDGTLIHYPDRVLKGKTGTEVLKLPPSSTGMRGVVSSKTLSLVQDIRQKGGVKFVLVSGMRTSTFLNRAPYLPRADAYCTEAGGRIFYPIDADSEEATFIVKPSKYDGCDTKDLEPFGLLEDKEWRKKMEKYSGSYGYSASLKDIAANPANLAPLNQRDGLLWDFARDLISKGYELDTKGYSSCFRVNKKLQDRKTISDDDFAKLSDGRITPWEGLATSINLACVDFYPSISGKKNCCQYVAEKFFPKLKADTVLRDHAVCLCDDDNDLLMAESVKHAYIPEVTAEKMAQAIAKNPSHFTQTGGQGFKKQGVEAAEAALLLVLDLFNEDPKADETEETEDEHNSHKYKTAES